MAQDQDEKEEIVKWKLGSLCRRYDRKTRKWSDGEVIGLFTNDDGEWVKVRCGQQIHEVFANDPDLRLKVKDKSTKS